MFSRLSRECPAVACNTRVAAAKVSVAASNLLKEAAAYRIIPTLFCPPPSQKLVTSLRKVPFSLLFLLKSSSSPCHRHYSRSFDVSRTSDRKSTVDVLTPVVMDIQVLWL